MKKFLTLVLIICIVIVLIFMVQKISNNYFTSVEKISEIKLYIEEPFLDGEYIFKEKENIGILLQLTEELKTFKSESDVNMSYKDIKFEIIYNNGTKKIISYEKIKPYPDLVSDILSTIEARKQRIPLLYEDTSNINKVTLKSQYPKMNSIEITDKEVIDEILLGLKEYYLSDKAINLDSLSRFMDIDVEIDGVTGTYKIYFDNDKLLNLLRELEIYDDLAITTADIKDMVLTKGNTSLEITDKGIIDIVMEKGYHGMNRTAVHIEATLNTSDDAKIYGCLRENEVPEEIEKLFE